MQFRQPVIVAVLAAVVAASVLTGPVTAASAAPDAAGTEYQPYRGADRKGDDEPRSDPTAMPSTRTIPLRPVGVSVQTDAQGFTVFATPQCSLATYCKSTFQVPSAGIDREQVNTRNGYFVPWPSGWVEGQSRTDGRVTSQACDVFFCYWNWNKGAALGTITRPYAPRALTASVVRKDDAARTARVEGTATPNASIRLNGSEVASVGSSGVWSHTLTGLNTGSNSRTFQQYVNGSYRDQTTVTVTIDEPVQPVEPDQIVGVAGTATLERGGQTTVHVTYTPKRRFSTPTGSLVVTAPEGTTFATGQDTQRGQYLDGGTWHDFGGDSLVRGQRSAGGRTYTFALGDRNWDVAKGQQFRFGLRVETPADITTLQSRMTGRLTGTIAGGTFDTTATTTTTVPDQAFTAAASFADDVTKPVTVGGTGVRGAQVVVLEGGVELARTTVRTDGTWSVTLAAPDRGGVRTVEAAQSGSGVPSAQETVRIDYGPAVTITSPGDGFVISPVFPDVRVSGTATPGAVVRLREQGGSGKDLGTATADDRGRWGITTPALDVRDQVLVATATSRGANTTTDTLALAGR